MPLGSLLGALLGHLGCPNRPKFGPKRILKAYPRQKRQCSPNCFGRFPIWAPKCYEIDTKRSWRVVFWMPNIVLAFAPFWTILVPPRRQGRFCSNLFRFGTFWGLPGAKAVFVQIGSVLEHFGASPGAKPIFIPVSYTHLRAHET